MKRMYSLFALLVFTAVFTAPTLSAATTNNGGDDDDTEAPATEKLTLRLKPVGKTNIYQLTVAHDRLLWKGEVAIEPGELVCKELEQGVSFCGTLSNSEQEFRGFIRSGVFHYQFLMTKTDQGELMGQWHKFANNEDYGPGNGNKVHFASNSF